MRLSCGNNAFNNALSIILIVGLSVVCQLNFSQYPLFIFKYSFPLLLTISLFVIFLMFFAWRVLGPTQRIAGIGLGSILLLTFWQGIQMHAYFGNSRIGLAFLFQSLVDLFLVCLLLYLVNCLPISRLEHFIRIGLIVSCVVVVTECYYSRFFEKGFLAPIDVYGVYPDAVRLAGFSGSPIATAAILILCWPAFLGRHFTRGSWKKQMLCYICIVGTLLTLLLTYTRSAYIGLIGQLLLLSLVLLRDRKHQLRLWCGRAILVIFGSCCFLMIMMPSIARRFIYLLSPIDASVSNRLSLFHSLISLFSERPLCGWGFGMFELLYKGYERIPGISYSYGTGHSTILLFLFQSGLIGCVLFIVAVFGWHLLRSFSHLPLWLGVSMVGVIPVMFVDNITMHALYFEFPFLLFMTLLVGFGRQYDQRFACPRWFPWSVSAAVMLWVIAALQSPGEPIDFLNKRLEQSIRRLHGDVSVMIGDLALERCWKHEGTTPYASILAGVVVPVHAALMNNPDMECPLRGFQVVSGGSELLGQVVPRRDLAALALANPTPSTVGYLLQAVSDEQIKKSNKELFGNLAYLGAKWREYCASCAFNEVKHTGVVPADGLKNIATTATVEQILRAYIFLTDLDTTGSEVIRAALSSPSDRTGFTRHIHDAGLIFNSSIYTGSFREEVLLLRGDWEEWGIIASYHSLGLITPRTDSACNRMFARMAWHVYCYLEIFAPNQEKPASGEEELKPLRPWFLRQGRTRWSTPWNSQLVSGS